MLEPAQPDLRGVFQVFGVSNPRRLIIFLYPVSELTDLVRVFCFQDIKPPVVFDDAGAGLAASVAVALAHTDVLVALGAYDRHVS